MKISQIAWMMSAAGLAEAKECDQYHAFDDNRFDYHKKKG